jgi:hypothetical protein
MAGTVPVLSRARGPRCSKGIHTNSGWFRAVPTIRMTVSATMVVLHPRVGSHLML